MQFFFFVANNKSNMPGDIILCLHGGTSADGFLAQLDWFKTTYQNYDYRIVPAVSSTPGWHSDIGKEDVTGSDADVFEASVETSINHIDTYINSQSITSIYGILGYSMGGFMALYYAAYLTSQNIPYNKLWIFNGYMAVNASLNSYLMQLTTPTFILTGENDSNFQTLTTSLANHFLPAGTPLFPNKTFVQDTQNDHSMISSTNTSDTTRQTLATFMTPITATIAADGATITLSKNAVFETLGCSWNTGYKYYTYTTTGSPALVPKQLIGSLEYVFFDEYYVFRMATGGTPPTQQIQHSGVTFIYMDDVTNRFQFNVITVDSWDGSSLDEFNHLGEHGIRANTYFAPSSYVRMSYGPFLYLASTRAYNTPLQTSIVKQVEAGGAAADAHETNAEEEEEQQQSQQNVSCTFSGFSVTVINPAKAIYSDEADSNFRNNFTFNSDNDQKTVLLEGDKIKKGAHVMIANSLDIFDTLHLNNLTNNSEELAICVHAECLSIVGISGWPVALVFDAPIPDAATAGHFRFFYYDVEGYSPTFNVSSFSKPGGSIIACEVNVKPTNTQQKIFYLIDSASGLQSNGIQLTVAAQQTTVTTTVVTVTNAAGVSANGFVAWDGGSAYVDSVSGTILTLAGVQPLPTILTFTKDQVQMDTDNEDPTIIKVPRGSDFSINEAGSSEAILVSGELAAPTIAPQDVTTPITVDISEAIVEKSSKYFQSNIDYPLTGPNILLLILNHNLDLPTTYNTLGEYTTENSAEIAYFIVTKNSTNTPVEVSRVHLENDDNNQSAIQLTLKQNIVQSDTNIKINYTHDVRRAEQLATSEGPIASFTHNVTNLLAGRVLETVQWVDSKKLVCSFNHQVADISVSFAELNVPTFVYVSDDKDVVITFRHSVATSVNMTISVYPAIYQSYVLKQGGIRIEGYKQEVNRTVTPYTETTADITLGESNFGFLVADEVRIDGITYVSSTKIYSEIEVQGISGDVFDSNTAFSTDDFSFTIGNNITTVAASSVNVGNIENGKGYIDLEVNTPFEEGQIIVVNYTNNSQSTLADGSLFPNFSRPIRNWLGPPTLTKLEVDEDNVLTIFANQPVYRSTGSSFQIFNGTTELQYTTFDPTATLEAPDVSVEDTGNQETTMWAEEHELLLGDRRIQLPADEVITDLRLVCTLEGIEEYHTTGPVPREYTLTDNLRQITTVEAPEVKMRSISCEMDDVYIEFKWTFERDPPSPTYRIIIPFTDERNNKIIILEADVTKDGMSYIIRIPYVQNGTYFSSLVGQSVTVTDSDRWGLLPLQSINGNTFSMEIVASGFQNTRKDVFCQSDTKIVLEPYVANKTAQDFQVIVPMGVRLQPEFSHTVVVKRKGTDDVLYPTMVLTSTESQEQLVLTVRDEDLTDLTVDISTQRKDNNAMLSKTVNVALDHVLTLGAYPPTSYPQPSANGVFQDARTLLVRFTRDMDFTNSSNISTTVAASAPSITYQGSTQMTLVFPANVTETVIISGTIPLKYGNSNYSFNVKALAFVTNAKPYVVRATIASNDPKTVVVVFSEKMKQPQTINVTTNLNKHPASFKWEGDRLQLEFADPFVQGEAVTLSGLSDFKEAVGNQQIVNDTLSVQNNSTFVVGQSQSMESAVVEQDGKTITLTFLQPVTGSDPFVVRVYNSKGQTTHLHTVDGCSERSECLLHSSVPAANIQFTWDGYTKEVLSRAKAEIDNQNIDSVRGFVLREEEDGSKFIDIVADNTTAMPSDYGTHTPYTQLLTKVTNWNNKSTWGKTQGTYRLNISQPNAKRYRFTNQKTGNVSLPLVRNKQAYGLFPGFTVLVSGKQVTITLPRDEVRIPMGTSVAVDYRDTPTQATNNSRVTPHFIRFNLGMQIPTMYKTKLLQDLDEAALYLCDSIDIIYKQQHYTQENRGNFQMHFAVGAYETQKTYNGGKGVNARKLASAFPTYYEVFPNSLLSAQQQQGFPPFCGTTLNICNKGPSSGKVQNKPWKGGFNGAYLCVNKEGKGKTYSLYTSDHETQSGNWRKSYHYYDDTHAYLGTKAKKKTSIQRFDGIEISTITNTISYFKEAATDQPNIVAYFSPVFDKQGHYTHKHGTVEIDKHSSQWNGTYTFKRKSVDLLTYSKGRQSVQILLQGGILQLNGLQYTMHNVVPVTHPNVPYTGTIHEPLVPDGGNLTCVVGSILVNRSRFFDGILSNDTPPVVERLYSKPNTKYVNILLHELLHCFGFHKQFSHFQFGYKNVRVVSKIKIGQNTFSGAYSTVSNENNKVPMQDKNHYHFGLTGTNACREIMEPTNQNCLKVTRKTLAMLEDCGWNVTNVANATAATDGQEFIQKQT